VLYGGVDYTNPPTIKSLPLSPIFHTLVGIIILAKSYPKIFLSLFVFLYPFPFLLNGYANGRNFDLWVTSQGHCPISFAFHPFP